MYIHVLLYNSEGYISEVYDLQKQVNQVTSLVFQWITGSVDSYGGVASKW